MGHYILNKNVEFYAFLVDRFVAQRFDFFISFSVLSFLPSHFPSTKCFSLLVLCTCNKKERNKKDCFSWNTKANDKHNQDSKYKRQKGVVAIISLA